MTDTKFHVYLVDGSAAFLAVASEWIAWETSLHVVGSSSSGTEALARIEALEPDVVILDAVLPGQNGFELTRRIKALPRAPKVLIATLYASMVLEEEALAAGADGFLAKDRFAEALAGQLERIGLPARPRRTRTKSAVETSLES